MAEAEEENEAPEEKPVQPETESNGEIGANKFLVKERFEIDYAQPLPGLIVTEPKPIV